MSETNSETNTNKKAKSKSCTSPVCSCVILPKYLQQPGEFLHFLWLWSWDDVKQAASRWQTIRLILQISARPVIGSRFLFHVSCGFSQCVSADDKLSAAPSVLYETGSLPIFTKQRCQSTLLYTSPAIMKCLADMQTKPTQCPSSDTLRPEAVGPNAPSSLRRPLSASFPWNQCDPRAEMCSAASHPYIQTYLRAQQNKPSRTQSLISPPWLTPQDQISLFLFVIAGGCPASGSTCYLR